MEMGKIADDESQEKNMQDSEKVSLGAQSIKSGTPQNLILHQMQTVLFQHAISFSKKGLVGSSKSSLLNVILGELDRLDG